MNKFLRLQGYGWCDIQLGDFKSRASYLTDVPIDCLEAAIQYIDFHQPIELHFDAEGWDVYVTGYDQNTLIRHTKTNSSEIEHIVLDDIDALDLAKQIYSDIASDIEGWTDFLLTFDDMEGIGYGWEYNVDQLLSERCDDKDNARVIEIW